MEINEKDTDMIEDFLSGTMSPEEENKFRERLKTEKPLAKAYSFRTKMSRYWNDAISFEVVRNQVKAIRNENKRRKRTIFFYVAASITILIGFTVFLMLPKPGPNDQLTDGPSPLSTNEQPEKGSNFTAPHEFGQEDTLVIKRTIDLLYKEKIMVRRIPDKEFVKEYVWEQGLDSLVIPLKDFPPGHYEWINEDKTDSAEFVVKENDI